MELTYYKNFSKRRNSTLRPSGGTTHNANLKQPTSTEAPVFILDVVDPDINYIKYFGNHYYFVTDIVVLNREQAEYHCVLDRAATYRSYILGSNQFVKRCADQNYYDTHIIDDSYPTKTEPTVYVSTGAPSFVTSGSAALVLTIKGNNGSQFWAMPSGYFNILGRELFGKSQEDLWSEMGDTSGLLKTYLDPFQYIVDAKIIPIIKSDMSGTDTHTIKIGYWSYTDSEQTTVFRELSDRVCYTSSEYSFSIQPAAPGVKAFTNSNRYRKYHLVLPGAGTIELDGDLVNYADQVKVKFSIDVAGGIAYEITTGTYKRYVSGSIGIPVAIHGQVADYSQTIGAGMNVLGGIVSGAGMGAGLGPIGAGVGAIAGGLLSIGRSISNAGPLMQTTSRGNDGSLASIAINKKIQLFETIYDITEIGVAALGAPCCKWLKLSKLSGYVECEKASISIPGHLDDKTEIENMLNTGIYIE